MAQTKNKKPQKKKKKKKTSTQKTKKIAVQALIRFTPDERNEIIAWVNNLTIDDEWTPIDLPQAHSKNGVAPFKWRPKID